MDIPIPSVKTGQKKNKSDKPSIIIIIKLVSKFIMHASIPRLHTEALLEN